MSRFSERVGAAVLVIASNLETEGIQEGRESHVSLLAGDLGSVNRVKFKGGRLLQVYCRDKGSAGAFFR